jgi:flagellin FlaB
MNWKKALTKLSKQKRGILGLEAAIILIAFVVIAAVFSFMVVNQGLFATERGKSVIEEGLKQASTPLSVDGTIFVRTSANGENITAILVPVKSYGVKYVPMWQNETAVSLKVGAWAWANVFNGTNILDPLGRKFDDLLLDDDDQVNATLFIGNSNGDESLDSFEKGYLVVTLGSTTSDATYAAGVRTVVNIEIRLEKSAPLSIDFTMPEGLPKGTWIGVGL